MRAIGPAMRLDIPERRLLPPSGPIPLRAVPAPVTSRGIPLVRGPSYQPVGTGPCHHEGRRNALVGTEHAEGTSAHNGE